MTKPLDGSPGQTVLVLKGTAQCQMSLALSD